MKKFFSLIAAVLFAGSMMAADATMAAGTNGSACTVNGAAGIKCGTSKAAGDMTITVGAGATQLTVYAAAWKGVNGASIAIATPEGVTANPASLAITADDGISNNTPFTLAGTEANFKFEIALSGVDAQTTLTLSCAKRFVVWNATYTTGEVAPVDNSGYYLVGSMNEWTPAAAYKFAANPAAEGEYSLDVTLATTDQFKVVYSADGVANTTWYPDGTNNNYGQNGEITADGDYTIYFRPEGNGGDDWFNGVIYAAYHEPYVKPEVFEVAEIIADATAGNIVANDTVAVRGIVTRMEMKGKNFAKYGSVNIYVADATGAEGTFEFYNCYSLAADTFAVTVPAFDATSNSFADVTEVTDRNGLTIHVGDTVIAKGKYTLYNSTHELQTGCYLVYAKAPGAANPTDVENVASEQKAVKVIREGQLFIMKNGVLYNAQGAVVR